MVGVNLPKGQLADLTFGDKRQFLNKNDVIGHLPFRQPFFFRPINGRNRNGNGSLTPLRMTGHSGNPARSIRYGSM